MTIEEVFEKAKLGGFERGDWSDTACYLDPAFWQSLGKAIAHDPANECLPENWVTMWHRFIDHLAAGKDAESFFETLT